MMKATRARYTLEFKQEAVRLVEWGQSIAAASKTLGLVEQTLFNWVKAHREGALKGADNRSKVTAEHDGDQPFASYDLARVTMERDIFGKSYGVLCQGARRSDVRLDSTPLPCVAHPRTVQDARGQCGWLPRALGSPPASRPASASDRGGLSWCIFVLCLPPIAEPMAGRASGAS